MDSASLRNSNSLLAKRSFYLLLGRVIPIAILFLITILFSRQLSYEDYGNFQSVWMFTNVINVFLNFGFSSLILSTDLGFLLSFIRKHRTLVVGFYTAIALIALSAFFFYARNFNSTTRFAIIGFILVQNATTVLESLLVKVDKQKTVMVSNFIYAVAFFTWHYYVLNSGFDLTKLIVGIIAITIIKCVVLFTLYKKQSEPRLVENDDSFKRHWLYLGIGDAAGVLSKWIDKLFLLYLLTPADFAVYFNGSFEIPIFGLLVSVVGSIMLLNISKEVTSTRTVLNIFNETYAVLSSIVFPLFLMLFFFNKELFALVFSDKYNEALPVFIVSIFMLPLRINNYTVILQCNNKGDKIMIGSLLDISLAWVFMLFLYPLFGTKGIALAIVMATYIQVGYYLWHSAKILQVGVLSLLPIKQLVISGLALFIVYFGFHTLIAEMSAVFKLIAASLLTSVLIVVMLLVNLNRPKISENAI